jgi:hypothetical protein
MKPRLLPPVRNSVRVLRIMGVVGLATVIVGVLSNPWIWYVGLLIEALAFMRADTEEALYA